VDTPARLIAPTAADYELADLSMLEPNIEDVITQIYLGAANPPAAD
jgi:ABC-type uncharacterized transport system ATPase subunit